MTGETGESGEATVASQRWKTAATVALVALMASPLVRSGDGVPLSSYPMYASPRADVVAFVVPAGRTADGAPKKLSTRTVAATNDPLVAESFLRDEVEAGRAASLCEQIAQRVGNQEIVAVDIRVERHRVVERIRGTESLVESRVAASCST